MADNIDYKRIGERIKRFRSMRGLSQEKLAERAQISNTYLSRVENGRRQASLEVLTRIAAALNIPLSSLIRGGIASSGHSAGLFPEHIQALLGDPEFRQAVVMLGNFLREEGE